MLNLTEAGGFDARHSDGRDGATSLVMLVCHVRGSVSRDRTARRKTERVNRGRRRRQRHMPVIALVASVAARSRREKEKAGTCMCDRQRGLRSAQSCLPLSGQRVSQESCASVPFTRVVNLAGCLVGARLLSAAYLLQTVEPCLRIDGLPCRTKTQHEV